MLQDMELWSKIRRLIRTGKISKRQAVKDFNLNFRTIKKIAENSEPSKYERPAVSETKLAPFLSFIENYLEEDKTSPRKQRHTKKRIFQRLRDEQGYTGCYRSVCKAMETMQARQKTLYMPLAHPHGEAQFDFGFADAVIGGVKQQVAYAAISLPYSNVRYVQAFPKECMETLQESLVRFFRFLGGVPRKITFDNSKVNVKKIIYRRGTEPSEGLLQIASHHLFEYHFCRIYEPQEKGHVENCVTYVRNNFMVPVPHFATFAAFNEYLEQKCRAEFDNTSAGREKTIGELFDEEKWFLLPLAEVEFESRRTELCRADNLSLVRFDCNDYSVPGEHAYKQFTAVGSIDTVRFLVDGKVVAEHPRDWGKKKTYYDPIHYLSIAERRPNGLDFGAPFVDWQLPDCFDVLRRRLERKADRKGTREYIRILRLLETYKLNELTRGIERALSHGATAYEGIRLYVDNEATVPVELFSLDGRPLLQQVQLPEPDINIYSTLLERNIYEETRNETDGAFEASFTAVETSDLRSGMRGGSLSLCEGEHRSSGLLASVVGAGTFGSGGASSPAQIESRTVPQFEDSGELRLQSATESEQDACDSVDAWRIYREPGVDHSDWSTRHGQDASCDGTGHSSVSDGQEGEVFSRERSDHSTVRGEGGEVVDSDEEGAFDVGRVGVG
jgi:transposase